MKKLLLFTVFFALAQASMFANSEKAFQEEENNFKKSQAVTQDGIRFDHLEKEFRAQYSHLNIPKITMIDDLVAKYRLSFAGYSWTNHELFVDKKAMGELPASSWKWLMLHETGHAQIPYAIPTIQGAVTTVQLLTPYFWGMHKKVPYRNIITKIGSKGIATLALSTLVNVNGMRIEERRADNFANKHADEQMLKGGIVSLENFQKQYENIWKLSDASQSMSLKTFLNLTDLLHPTPDSRIAKMKKALKNRFGVEA